MTTITLTPAQLLAELNVEYDTRCRNAKLNDAQGLSHHANREAGFALGVRFAIVKLEAAQGADGLAVKPDPG